MSGDYDQRTEDRVHSAVAEAVNGSSWAPDEGGVLVDCVVVMGWRHSDGTYGVSRMICGSPWSARGLLADALAKTEADFMLDSIDDTGDDS